MRMALAFGTLATLVGCQPTLEQKPPPAGDLHLRAQLPTPKSGFAVQDAGLNRVVTASVEFTGFGIPSPIRSGPTAVTVAGGIPTLIATFTGIPNGKNRLVWVRGHDSRGFDLPGIEVGGVFDVPGSGTLLLNRQTTAAARLYGAMLRLSATSDTKNLTALLANTNGANLSNFVQNALSTLGLADPDQLDLMSTAKAVADANQGRAPATFFTDSPRLPAPSTTMKAAAATIPVTVNAPSGAYRLAYSDRFSPPVNLLVPATGLTDSSQSITGALPAPYHVLTFEKLSGGGEAVSRLTRQVGLPIGSAIPVRPITVSPEQAPIGATITVAIDDSLNPTGTDGPYFGSAVGQVRMQETNLGVTKWGDRAVQFKLPNTLNALGATEGILVSSMNRQVTGEVLGLFRILPGPPQISKVVQSGGTIVIQGDNFSEISTDHVVTYTPASGTGQSPSVTPIGVFPVSMLSFPGTLQRGDTLRVAIGGVLSNVFGLNWIPRAALNHSRFNFAFTEIDGSVYALAGQTSGSTVGPAEGTVEKLDPTANTWTDLTLDPVPASLLAKPGAGVTADTNGSPLITNLAAFVFGGTDMYRFDPVAAAGARWSGILASTSTRLNLGMAGVNVGTGTDDWKIYLFGGNTGTAASAMKSVEVFRVSDSSLTPLTTGADMGAARYGMAAVAVGGKIYAIGGFDNTGTPVSTLERFDPASETWTPLASLPTARGDVRATAIGNKIYVSGGISGTLQDRMDVYDIAANSWTALTPMGSPRRSHGMAAVNNKLYVFGGKSASSSAALASSVFDSCEEFDTSGP